MENGRDRGDYIATVAVVVIRDGRRGSGRSMELKLYMGDKEDNRKEGACLLRTDVGRVHSVLWA